MRSLRIVWSMPLFAALPVVSTGCIPASEKHLPVASSVKPYCRLPAGTQSGSLRYSLAHMQTACQHYSFRFDRRAPRVVTMILLLYLGGDT